jgi:hypothetical protein
MRKGLDPRILSYIHGVNDYSHDENAEKTRSDSDVLRVH